MVCWLQNGALELKSLYGLNLYIWLKFLDLKYEGPPKTPRVRTDIVPKCPNVPHDGAHWDKRPLLTWVKTATKNSTLQKILFCYIKIYKIDYNLV